MVGVKSEYIHAINGMAICGKKSIGSRTKNGNTKVKGVRIGSRNPKEMGGKSLARKVSTGKSWCHGDRNW